MRESRVTLRIPRGGSRAALLDLVCIEVEVARGADAGARRRVTTETLRIGAARENDLVLTDPAASRSHAEVLLEGDGLRVRDLGSTNGTVVRGARIPPENPVPLGPGEEFEIGTSVLRARPVEEHLREPVQDADRLGELVGRTPAMRDLHALLRAVAPTGVTVLVTGETGTGKELVAREIHRLSGRPGAFATFDAAAVDPSQIASALFGHRRGAFTGASEAREGAARHADGGTLFLDEIGELPLELQPRLLRLLERREVTPLGADRAQPVDVRVVAATHRDLRAAVAAGTFREDLLHRLAVVEIQAPALRERLDDLPLLVDEIAARAGLALDLTEEGWTALRAHPWPGNVRELRNCLERAGALAGAGPIGARELGLGRPAGSPAPAAPSGPAPAPAAAETASLEDVERETILRALARNDGHRVRTAEDLGISLNTLKRRVRRYREEGHPIPGD